MCFRGTPNFVSALIALGSVACTAGAEQASVPELRTGDVLLCEPYPYRTVTQTSRTVYQVARLGFSSVRSFQQAHRLKVDGIIGPITQQRAEAEFARRFGEPPAGTTDTPLSVLVQPVATETSITATVSIRGRTGRLPRIVGTLKHDELRGFQLTGPSVTLYAKTCLRRNGNDGLVVCGGRSVTATLSQADEPTGDASLPALRAGESGRLYATVTYLSADLAERVAKSDLPLPTVVHK